MQFADPACPPIDLRGGELRAEHRVGVAALRRALAGAPRVDLRVPVTRAVAALAAAFALRLYRVADAELRFS
ncbi:MAG: hypothetical protein ACKOTF_05060, partial [Opitutaceae bacterium]